MAHGPTPKRGKRGVKKSRKCPTAHKKKVAKPPRAKKTRLKTVTVPKYKKTTTIAPKHTGGAARQTTEKKRLGGATRVRAAGTRTVTTTPKKARQLKKFARKTKPAKRTSLKKQYKRRK